ncbi:hypothetical protein OUZ56_027230 [Daphnia magna]|uniref:Uncharacterized protein n=1 Tax=Daphnia magna TaxID=35525 RepID=A0ABQ9ZP56_9CRUS|nr:hypothetical protein OUZ56_027230 [Daphnia magna]
MYCLKCTCVSFKQNRKNKENKKNLRQLNDATRSAQGRPIRLEISKACLQCLQPYYK